MIQNDRLRYNKGEESVYPKVQLSKQDLVCKERIIKALDIQSSIFEQIKSAGTAVKYVTITKKNILNIKSIALVEYSQKRNSSKEDPYLKSFLEASPEMIYRSEEVRPRLLTDEEEKAKSDAQTLKLEGIKTTGELNKILDPSPEHLTGLEILYCSLSKDDWKLVIKKLPPKLENFTITGTYLDAEEGKELGLALAARPIREFRICLFNLDSFDKDEKIAAENNRQKGLRKLWSYFGQSELRYLDTMYISDCLFTGDKEWMLTASIIYKCLLHGHVLPTKLFGFNGEINYHSVKSWLRAAQIVHAKNLINTLTPDQCEVLPGNSWKSYQQLVININALKK